MGYYPFEHWVGRAQVLGWAQAAGGRAGGMGAPGVGALGSTGARQADVGRGLGVLLGQWAVHSVHSACFWPDLTQYCS